MWQKTTPSISYTKSYTIPSAISITRFYSWTNKDRFCRDRGLYSVQFGLNLAMRKGTVATQFRCYAGFLNHSVKFTDLFGIMTI